MITICIQEGDFDAAAEKHRLQRVSPEVGAVVEFTGCVRADAAEVDSLQAIFLEHYPHMTERAIAGIVEQAFGRWPLLGVTVIHRVGTLAVGQNIVYVGVASAHRRAGLEAVGFIMDFLKNDVPIWKKAIHAQGGQWLGQKQTDVDAKKAWQPTNDS